jgi:O-antigen/teichoic acid export membrane protein
VNATAAQRIKSLFRRTARSAVFYGAIGTMVRVGANFLLLPIVLAHLSQQEQALWWVFLSLGAAANLVDFGFGQSLSRVYSYFNAGASDFDVEGLGAPPVQAEPNVERLRVLNATARRLYTRLSLGASVLLAAVGSLFVWRLAGLMEDRGSVWIGWSLYVLVVGYTLATSQWNIACTGVNRMRELQASNLWSGLIYLAVATGLLILNWGLYALVAGSASRAMTAHWLCRRAFHRAVPLAEGSQPTPEPELLRKLWPNAWKFGVLSIGVFLTYKANVLVCSYFLGDDVTASFGLTAQLGDFLTAFSGLWLLVKWPEVTMLRVQGRLEEMSALFARRLALVMGTFVIGALALLFLGNRLLEWKGSQTRLLPAAYLAVYLVYVGQQHFYAQFGSLTYTENTMPFFKLALLTGLAVFLLSALLTWRWGLWGLICGPLMATMAVCTWYVPWRGFRGQPLTVRQFIRAAVIGRP